MANAYLMISLIVIIVLLIVVNGYLLAYYCHPDDGGFGATLFCKILVVVGLTVAWAMVLLLPLDVANSRGYGGGLPMKEIWYIVISAVALLSFLLIPFSIFYYETDEELDWNRRACHAAQLSFCTFLVIIITVFILFGFFATADIPVTACAKNVSTFQKSSDPLQASGGQST